MVDPNDIIFPSNIAVRKATSNAICSGDDLSATDINISKINDGYIYLETRKKIEGNITELSEYRISMHTIRQIINAAMGEGLTPEVLTATEDDTCYSLLMNEIRNSLSMDIEKVLLNNYDNHLWELAITSKNLEENKDKIKEISKGRKILSKKIRSTDCSISIYLAERKNFNDRSY